MTNTPVLGFQNNFFLLLNPAAIRELEKIGMVRRNGKSYKLDHAVTKTQKIILSSFGLDEKYISKKATEISQLLYSCQSLMNTEVTDDGKEENDSID